MHQSLLKIFLFTCAFAQVANAETNLLHASGMGRCNLISFADSLNPRSGAQRESRLGEPSTRAIFTPTEQGMSVSLIGRAPPDFLRLGHADNTPIRLDVELSRNEMAEFAPLRHQLAAGATALAAGGAVLTAGLTSVTLTLLVAGILPEGSIYGLGGIVMLASIGTGAAVGREIFARLRPSPAWHPGANWKLAETETCILAANDLLANEPNSLALEFNDRDDFIDTVEILLRIANETLLADR